MVLVTLGKFSQKEKEAMGKVILQWWCESNLTFTVPVIIKMIIWMIMKYLNAISHAKLEVWLCTHAKPVLNSLYFIAVMAGQAQWLPLAHLTSNSYVLQRKLTTVAFTFVVYVIIVIIVIIFGSSCCYYQFRVDSANHMLFLYLQLILKILLESISIDFIHKICLQYVLVIKYVYYYSYLFHFFLFFTDQWCL